MKIIMTTLAGAWLVAGVYGAAATDQTIANLNTAFRGESNASRRYELFAQRADQEGFAQVAALFRAASRAEAIHRDTHQKAIERLGGTVDKVKLDEVVIGSTRENLQAAIKGESEERDSMYPDFLKQAEFEQAKAAVRSLTFALEAERGHAKLYQEALDNLGHNAKTDYFVCAVCGFTTTQLPGKNCPSCHTSRDKFIRNPTTAKS